MPPTWSPGSARRGSPLLLGFGIIIATFVTLILVPVNYIVLEDLRRGWRRVYGGEASLGEDA